MVMTIRTEFDKCAGSCDANKRINGKNSDELSAKECDVSAGNVFMLFLSPLSSFLYLSTGK